MPVISPDKYKYGLIFFFFASFLCFSLSIQASIDDHRKLFKQAERALADNNQPLFSNLIHQLQDYPILAYLQYDAFRKELSTAKYKDVNDFIEQHQGYPFNYHLLSKWLDILAERKDWTHYLSFYDGRNNKRHQCLALTARLNTGQLANINAEIRKIWLSGYSQPEECDPPFKYFLESEENVSTVIWQRIEKAFKARRPSLARYLARKLDKKDQAIVDLWYKSHRDPALLLADSAQFKDELMNRKIILHALDRLARRDSLKAKTYWNSLLTEFQFSSIQKDQIDQRIALSAAYQHKAEAKQLLEKLPAHLKSDNAHLWLARINLRDEDWIGLVRTIDNMPKHLQNEAEWVYWHARAYEQSGHAVKAEKIYQKLDDRSSYYGFLAADRTGKDYHINNQQISVDNPFDEATLLNKSIHLLRARELFFVGRLIEARREWFQGIRKLNQNEIKQAASMASQWKWHDNAIKTVAKTPHRSDYELRFPMPYQKLVMKNVELNELDPAVIYGVMRRESLFDPLASSRVGALGLMQLMPATARSVAKSMGLKRPGRSDILNITNNIRFGTRYFKTVLNQFDDNVSLAAAAYNAGPKNVKKWLPEDENLTADLWVETVPFKETRNYIQAVLAYATIFDKHLGRKINISSRMADVKPSY